MTERATLIYADERLVAINKPAGVSLATRRGEPGAAVERLIAALPEEERLNYGLETDQLWLVHRLDVGTSGLVLLARDQATHKGLIAAFGEREVEKTYLALVWGKPGPQQGYYDWPLGPDRDDRRRMKIDPAGRRAKTEYLVLGHAPHVSLVELHPHTGRTHQLRVHLAHAGHPIVGDDLYGGPRHHGVRDVKLKATLQADHPFLHAWRLHLPAKSPAGELFLAAPLPADFVATLGSLGLSLPSF